jgi:hypothetical protein
MTPTLVGRLQTRVFVTLVVGAPWTLLLAAVLPGISLRGGLAVLIAMGVVGLGWELLYHWLMGFRWEKDWPSLVALLSGIDEALLLGVLLRLELVPGASPGPSVAMYLVHFVTVWLLMWAWLQGPMKVLDPRWRFRGGRVL